MLPGPDQILTVAQMRAAEQALIDAGSSVDALMQVAGRGAAEWVWRIAAGRPVTVLCGPGNNGGDGYVIAESIRERGGVVVILAATGPRTDAARNARALYQGQIFENEASYRASGWHGDVLVDCLFGSGLARPLSAEHIEFLTSLANSHRHRIAVDLPSGIDADSGALLNAGLPAFDLTVALGAWKFAHFLLPSRGFTGDQRLVDIGIALVPGAATALTRPALSPPAIDAHKYRRGLLAVVGGAMRGAALLAARAAQGAGAGYVKLFTDSTASTPADLVVDSGPLSAVLTDDRNAAVLVGPGLGRDATARERLATALADPVPVVIDADALVLLGARQLSARTVPTVATPHEGELAHLEKTFALAGTGSKVERARALAAASGMVIVAKGPDTVIAAPDGRVTCATPASRWLSTAGTGDVLAGIIASRLATGEDAYTAASQGVWLHGQAARLLGPAFTAGQLADAVPAALAAALS